MPKFEIKHNCRSKQWRSYLIADNGEKLFWSETYQRFAGALKATKLARGSNHYPITRVDINSNRFPVDEQDVDKLIAEDERVEQNV